MSVHGFAKSHNDLAWQDAFLALDESVKEATGDRLNAGDLMAAYLSDARVLVASIPELNKLLAIAKKTKADLAPFDVEADEANRTEQKRTYQENLAAENDLYKALVLRSDNKVATSFRLNTGTSGTIGTIGTTGMLTMDAMLNYASEVGSKYCFQGISLWAIEAFCDGLK